MDEEQQEEQQIPAEEPIDLRSALDAAITEHETEDSFIEGEPPEQKQQSSTDDEEDGDAAREVQTSEKVDDEPQQKESPKEKVSKAKPGKAPVGWKGKAKESWNELPDETKQAISEREREISVKLQETADARRVAENFSQLMQQHREPLQGLGFKDPFEAVGTILATVTAMRTGSTQQRAQAAANVLTAFGIDYATLDDIVSAGGGSLAENKNVELETLLDQRLKPVNDFMSQLEAAQYQNQQRSAQATQTEIQDFIDAHEHAETVRNDMADLLDMAAQRGVNMSLEDAYNKACMMHPDISAQLIEEKHLARVAQTREQYQKKKKAASSIHGRPAGNGKPSSGNSLQDALNEAWDIHTGT